MPPARKQFPVSQHSRRLLACGLLLLALGTGVRLWHDRNAAHTTVSSDVEMLKNSAISNPGNIEAQVSLGSALQKAGRLDEAREVFMQAEKLDPRDARPIVWLGMLAVQRHEVDDAVGYFKEALRRNPSDAEVCRSLGELYERQGAIVKSIGVYERATQLHPDDDAAWRMLGLANLRIGRLARGREALQHAIKLAPNDLKAISALADVDLSLGLLEEARWNYGVVLNHTPNDPAALTGMAQTSVQLDPSPEGLKIAEDQVNRAISLHSTPRCFLVRGHLSLLRQRYPEAIDDLNRAVGQDPHLAEAYGYLSQVYAASGRPEQARKAMAAYETARANRKQATTEIAN